MTRADFDVVGSQPQYPCEAREAAHCHEYREARSVLLDEARTARLMQRAAGRRVSTLYAKDLRRVQRDMVLERAIFWRACNLMAIPGIG